jgi:hypothetical protein
MSQSSEEGDGLDAGASDVIAGLIKSKIRLGMNVKNVQKLNSRLQTRIPVWNDP